MKKIKVMSLLTFALLLFTACGSLPTDGLTASMGANQTNTTQQDFSLGYAQQAIAQCNGDLNADSNLLRVSFLMSGDMGSLGVNGNEFSLFGGGTELLGEIGPEMSGSFRFRCEGAGEVTALPLQTGSKTAGWIAAVNAPKLTLESPSGQTKVLENVTFHGVIAASAEEIPGIIETVYGVQTNNGYQAFWEQQKMLYTNFPNADAVQQRALSNGMSEANAAQFGELFVEQDVAKQRQLLLDIVTSENKAYVEAVVGATIKSLLAAGLSPDEITTLFDTETNGRISVQFADTAAASPSDLDVQLTQQDNAGNISLTASSTNAVSSDGSGGSGGGGGGGGGADGGNTGGADGGNADGGNTGGADGGNTGGGADGGNTGGADGGSTGGGNTGGGNTGGGGRTPGEFARDLLWNIFMGAAAGATLGTPLGPEGAVGGAVLGGFAGAAYTIAGGFYDPNPNESGGPCKSPIIFC